jgi:hypothetical protein
MMSGCTERPVGLAFTPAGVEAEKRESTEGERRATRPAPPGLRWAARAPKADEECTRPDTRGRQVPLFQSTAVSRPTEIPNAAPVAAGLTGTLRRLAMRAANRGMIPMLMLSLKQRKPARSGQRSVMFSYKALTPYFQESSAAGAAIAMMAMRVRGRPSIERPRVDPIQIPTAEISFSIRAESWLATSATVRAGGGHSAA